MGAITKFAFYGTLRRGMGNFQAFQHGLEYIRKVVLEGYRMYSKASYPYVVWTGDASDKITAELFQIIDPEVHQAIHELEFSAGYILEYVTIESEKFGIYVFAQNFNEDPLIKSGDWTDNVTRARF